MKSLELENRLSILKNLKTIEVIDRKLLKKIIDNIELGTDRYNDTYENEKAFLNSLHKKISDKSNYMTVTYKQDIGRVYPLHSLSLSTVRRPLRHTLAEGNYIDIDIKNCQPTILHQICKANDIDCVHLERYVNNRESLLEEITKEYECTREEAKNLFLVLMNSGNFDKWANNLAINKEQIEYLSNFSKELKNITQHIIANNTDLHKKNKLANKLNPESSTFALFLQHYECIILEKMYEYLKLNGFLGNGAKPYVVLCHDGLMIPKKDNIDTVELLNNLEKEIKKKTDFDIKLEIKPFNEKIDMIDNSIKDDNFEFKYTTKFNTKYFAEFDSYELQKKYFELFICKVMRPSPMYIYTEYNIEERRNETLYYSETKLKESFRHVGNEFMKTWLKDCNMRTFNDLMFKPINPGFNINSNSSEQFNTFEGYSPLIKTTVIDNTIIDEWKNVVFQLCEGIQENYDYYIRFLAQMIQFPEKRTGISILFRSNEGVGKNQHLEAIQNILTKNYYFSSAKKDDFVGKFALAFQNKLLLNWNETGSCADSIDEIKSKITDEYVTVEKKGIDKIECKNYARIIFTTNNLCPLPISNSNRRFVIFQATDYYIENGGVAFWTEFNKTINKPEFIACLYNYLNSIDLSDWEYKKFPKTKAYDQMRNLYISPEILFINDYILRNPKNARVKGTNLFRDYNEFCNQNKLNQKYSPDIRTFYAKIENVTMEGICGITKCTVSGGVLGFALNGEQIKKSLKDKGYLSDQDYRFIEEDKEPIKKEKEYIKKDIDY